MNECYILETDIFIEPAKTPVFFDTGVIEVLGFKDKSTTATDGPYGGMSAQVVRTGGTPTEATVFLLDVATGSRPDAEEGISLAFVEDLTSGVRSAPFEEIHLRLGNTNGDPVFVLTKVTGTVAGGDGYRIANGTQNVLIEKWFRSNLNNTPGIQLKCYPTAP
jgi:hypothetical protein